MIYEIILKLAVESGDSEIRAWFKKAMKSDHNDASGDTFTALFAKCPFERTAFHVRDGRNVAMHNSGFGAVYPVVDGKPLPVCEIGRASCRERV